MEVKKLWCVSYEFGTFTSLEHVPRIEYGGLGSGVSVTSLENVPRIKHGGESSRVLVTSLEHVPRLDRGDAGLWYAQYLRVSSLERGSE